MRNRIRPATVIATDRRHARASAFSVLLVVLTVAACREPSTSTGSATQQAAQRQQQQEAPDAPQFPALNAPPADVDGLQTYEIVAMLMRLPSGESACDDSRPVVVEHMEADAPGEYVRIPADLSLDETVPVALLTALEAHGLPFTAYKFRWIEEWRIVMFAPPRGAWDGTAESPLVIELGLSRVSERELTGDETGARETQEFLWSVNSAASMIGCVPAPRSVTFE
ncbi:MAG: hypothetical protein OXN86_12155 [Chloroflexota bacterium]|nr:hypothetical protein [Chloroflexota bacterium]